MNSLDRNMRYLSYWDKKCSIEQMTDWCGNYDLKWKKDIRNIIQIKGYNSVLDIGAGIYSEYYGFLADRYDIAYKATEITDKFITFGIKQNIDVVNCNIENLFFGDSIFDCVICYDVLNHQLDYKKGISEMIRVCRKEIFISFFKPFIEENIFKASIGSAFKTQPSDLGIIQYRFPDFIKRPICIYHYYSKIKLKEYLESLGVVYKFISIDDKVILKISVS